jgi:hypothetical protein
MSVTLSWLSGDQTQEASFDAVVTETHSRSAQVTSHPVEQGADVADHVYIEPLHLTLECVVTNTPLATPATQNRNSRGEVSTVNGKVSLPFGAGTYTKAVGAALQFSQDMLRPRDVYEALRKAFNEKSAFSVDTALEIYHSMVITALSVPREAGSGAMTDKGVRVDRLTFSIEMQQIRVASSKTGEVRRPKAGAPKKKENKGDKNKKEADTLQSGAWTIGYGDR